MERVEVEEVLKSIEQIRAAYRREIEIGEDAEFVDDLIEIIETAEQWLLKQINLEAFK